MNSRMLALSLAMLGAAVFASSTQAQRHAAFSSPPASRPRTALLRRGGAGTSFAQPRRMLGICAVLLRRLRFRDGDNRCAWEPDRRAGPSASHRGAGAEAA